MSEIMGRGTVYCLGLFLAHSERYIDDRIDDSIPLLRIEMWFGDAGDHLRGLVIPKGYPYKLKMRMRNLKKFVLRYGNGELNPTASTISWAIVEAEEILYEIDKLHGITPEKGHGING